MAFVLDNLTAFFVGTTLFVVMLAVQQRGQAASIEATTRYRTERLTAEFLRTLERDVENARTMADMSVAFAGVQLVRTGTASLDGVDYTRQFVFPTLLDPESDDPSETVLVVYEVVPTGRTVLVEGAPRKTLRARRYVLEPGATAVRPAGGSSDLIDFDVRLAAVDGSEYPPQVDLVDRLPAEVHLAAVAAAPVPSRRAGDQAAARATIARHARTVRVISAAVAEDNALGSAPVSSLPTLPNGL